MAKTAAASTTAASLIVQHLIDEGIKFVTGITGDTVLPVLDAMYDRRDEIRYVTCRLEHGAIGMADAYSRVTGESGCCLLHVGPGISNAVLGTWIAQKDAVPLIVLSGNMDTFRLGRNLWHEFNVMGVFREVTKWNDQLREAKDVKRLMRTAFQIARSGMPGPVHLDLPKDVVKQPADSVESADLSLAGPARSTFVANRSRPDPEAVERACRLLAAAEHPVIFAGRGAIWSKASDSLAELAERLAAPVVTTEMGRGAISEDHPLCFGIAGHFGRSTANETLRRADVVLGLGCRFLNVNTINWSLIRKDAKIIQVESDPLEIGRQYAVEVGALADAGCFLAEALAYCKAEGIEDERGPEHPRVKSLAELHAKETAAFFGADLNAVPIKPQLISREVMEVCDPDAIISVGAGSHTQYAHHIKIRRPDQYLSPIGAGAMAFGFAAGLGAKLAYPDRQVIVAIGDGDFGMMTQELETSVRENIPVVVIVYNDCGYGALRLFQKTYYGERYLGSDYGQTDFAKLAEAYGARGELIEKPGELRPALERALAADVTTVLDVRTNPWEVHYRAPEFKEFHKF
ncbi:MAG: thiamine pyrophosphate-binding protein [Nitrospinota bacterium]